MILSAIFLGFFLQQEKPESMFRFEVDVHTVYVDVFVSRDGHPVTNLTHDDFIVLDNGIAQEINLVDPQTVHWSVLLVLDTSASLFGDKLEHLRSAAHAFVDGLSSDDEAGLMIFAQDWRLQRGLTRDFQAIHIALDLPVQGGFTGLNDALYAGIELVGEGTGRPMVLLFTDGVDNASWLTGSEVVDLVRRSEAVVNVVSIRSTQKRTVPRGGHRMALRTVGRRDGPDELQADQYLEKISSSTGGRIWYADTSANLEEVFLNVLQDMESRYLLSYQARGAPQDGRHKIRVKLTEPMGAEIRARTGYMVLQRD